MEDSPDAGRIIQDHRNLHNWTNKSVGDNDDELPLYMKFNDGHRLSIAAYSVLLVFSAVANMTVLVLLVKRKRVQPSRINTMLMHLAIADLMVTFLIMPLEIVWAYTVQWLAGDAMCRIMSFFRTFGLYLSSFILCCLSIDRYYAVMKPLQLVNLDRRERLMILGAWIGAAICSAPQIYIFHLEHHPAITWYWQCVSFNIFPNTYYELAYNIFVLMAMYALPLVVVLFSYSSILLEIFRRTRNPGYADGVTRSSLAFLGRAKIRTLKMTIIIVLVFFVCWTPYQVMCIWYWYDGVTALKVDARIQKGLFLFACTNSCANPVVYGIFNIRARRRTARCSCRSKCTKSQHNDNLSLHSWKRSTTSRQDTCFTTMDVQTEYINNLTQKCQV